MRSVCNLSPCVQILLPLFAIVCYYVTVNLVEYYHLCPTACVGE